MLSGLLVHLSRLAPWLPWGVALALSGLAHAENLAPVRPDAPASHIALLLPLNAGAFRQPAEAVKQGFLAAAKAQPHVAPVRIYPTSEQLEQVLTAYQQARDAGAAVIVGPLTKNAVAALAASSLVKVPTIALSAPDGELALPDNLYLFSLSLDAETRQVARAAFAQGNKSILIVNPGSALGKRLQTSFSDEWRRLGGESEVINVATNSDLEAFRDKVAKLNPSALFIAGDARDARTLRPYLPAVVALYATSQVFSGQREAQLNIDLTGLRFLDMPWLMQPDHAAVMIYPRSETSLNAEGERLYAMGIDALRLADLFYRAAMPAHGVVLDGVTGQLSLSDHQFLRELVTVEFQAGQAVVLDADRP